MKGYAVLSVLLYVSLVAAINGRKIIGGHTAIPGKFPYMALLQKNGVFICGGSLITRRHVLTAKHCVPSGSPSQYRVVLGEHRRLNNDGTEQVKNVISICRHPTVDAALLYLSGSVTLNSVVKTIKLATSLPPFSAETTISGWGWTINGVSSASNALKYINLPRASTAACNSEGLNIRPHELCIGKSTGDYMNACRGDSGSPLVYPSYPNSSPSQIGIAERVKDNRCPKRYHYAVFVSIPSIYSWIISNCQVNQFLVGSWTQWYDNDDPSGSGDIETLDKISPRPCGGKTPVDHQIGRVSTTSCRIPHPHCAKLAFQEFRSSNSHGFTCLNREQMTIGGRGRRAVGWDGGDTVKLYCKCCDYRIRFRCPL